LEKQIIKVFKYFDFFNYPPTKEEIYCFLKKKASFDQFSSIFENMIKRGVVTRVFNSQFSISDQFLIFNKQYTNQPRYTVGEYGIKKAQSTKLKVQNYLSRQSDSFSKLNGPRFKIYIKILKFFSQIKLVGLSGSLSMLNATRNDDIDLFVITAENRLYTARFLALMFAQLLSLRRKRWGDKGKNKVCLNLFFDEKNLSVPSFKRNNYVAHEVLQMKPIINKDVTYEKFLQANLWVKKVFPNSRIAKSRITNCGSRKYTIKKIIGNLIEKVLKKIQLFLINKHKTTELIIDSQLWFHPEDFEKKLSSTDL